MRDINYVNHMKIAHERVQKEILPVLEAIYDEVGPVAVLTLAVMVGDIWLATGFAPDGWREIIGIYDWPISAEALPRR
jgi:hypothetical protein